MGNDSQHDEGTFAFGLDSIDPIILGMIAATVPFFVSKKTFIFAPENTLSHASRH